MTTTYDPSNLGYHPNHQAQPQIILSPEELAVLKACNSEGLRNRGVPAALAVGGGTYYALKSGFLKPHPRFGMIPAIAIAGVVGCVTGSLSYKSICMERVLNVPNGLLRKQLEAMQGMKPNRGEASLESIGKYDLDIQGPMASGSQMDIYQSNNDFDGYTGVNTDSDASATYDITMPKYNPGLTTYDDLRHKNRDDYERSISDRKNLPPSRAVPPLQSQAYTPMDPPPGSIFDDPRPFDRDRVPQYQLND